MNTDLPSAGESAKELLIRAGGADEVCKEADEIFQKYGVEKQTFFHGDILKDYPAVTSLGKVDYIMPDYPSYIKIRVGTHLNGYIMKIVDTNTDAKFQMDQYTLEVVKDRVFVSR